MATKQLLIDARALLIERGVNRDGGFVNEETGCQLCALGALEVAGGATVQTNSDGRFFTSIDPALWNPDDYLSAKATLRDALYAEHQTYWIPGWNDETETDEEVIAIFDRAIASLP